MNTTEPRLIRVEQVDDIPVLFALVKRLRLAELLDRHFHPHHLWKGDLTIGEVLSTWLVFLLSQGDHRMSHLQPWAQQHPLTLQSCLGKTVRPLDFHDDRLADLLDLLAHPDLWRQFECDLNAHTVRVYDLETSTVRIDTTTANSYIESLSQQGLLQFGHSKDNDDLPQVKIAVAALDPLGMPLTTLVVAGNEADDPLYVPEIKKVQQALGRGGKTYVGDCKMAALGTRAYLACTGDFYLCPLSEHQLTPGQRRSLLLPVWDGRQTLEQVHRPAAKPGDEPELVAEGFCLEEPLQAVVDGRLVWWAERRWLVRSVAYANGQQQNLQRRLDKAQEQLQELPVRKQGKKRLDAGQLQEAAQGLVAEHGVEGLLSVQVRAIIHKRKVRRYGERPQRVVRQKEYRVEVRRREEAIGQACRELGWRVYGSNQQGLGLAGVVWGYRGQYRVEDDWSRMKGKPLSLTPMYLKEQSRIQGLVLLLSLGLRLLTLLEYQVRKKLQEGGQTLKGIYPGQPGRQTRRPGAELLLRAFRGVGLTVVEIAGEPTTFITPLNDLQKRLVALWDFPEDLFLRLLLSPIPPP